MPGGTVNRVDQYLAVLNDPSLPPISNPGPADALIRALLVHVAFADGEVEEDEFGLLERLIPEKDAGELLSYIADTADNVLDLDALADALPTRAERDSAILLAEVMAARDERVVGEEREMIGQLMAAFRRNPGSDD